MEFSKALTVYQPTEDVTLVVVVLLSMGLSTVILLCAVVRSMSSDTESELDMLKKHYADGIARMMDKHTSDMAKMEERINAYTDHEVLKVCNATDNEIVKVTEVIDKDLTKVNTDLKKTKKTVSSLETEMKEMKRTLSFLMNARENAESETNKVSATLKVRDAELGKVNAMLLEALKLIYELDHKYASQMTKLEVKVDAQQEEVDSIEEQMVDRFLGYNAENQLKFTNIANELERVYYKPVAKEKIENRKNTVNENW